MGLCQGAPVERPPGQGTLAHIREGGAGSQSWVCGLPGRPALGAGAGARAGPPFSAAVPWALREGMHPSVCGGPSAREEEMAPRPSSGPRPSAAL